MPDPHQILTLLNELAKVMPWDAVVYAPVVAVVLLGIKKLKKIDNGEIMLILLAVFSGAGNLAEYLLQTPSHDPAFVAVKAVLTALFSQPVYFLVLKPAVKYFEGEMQKAIDNSAEIKSAAVPAAGLSIGATAPALATSIPVQDFKD